MARKKTIKEYFVKNQIDSSESKHSVRRLIVKLYQHFLYNCNEQLPQYAECEKKLNYMEFVIKDAGYTAQVTLNVCVEREGGTPFDSIQISANFGLQYEILDIMKGYYDDFNRETQRSMFDCIVKETFSVDVDDLCPDID